MSRRSSEWALAEPPRLGRSDRPAKKLRVQSSALEHFRAELEATRLRYAAAYDALPIAHVTLDRDGRVFEANRAACSLIGASKKVVEQKRLSAFMPPEEARLFPLFVAEVLRGGERRSCGVSLCAPDGTSRLVRLAATPVLRGGSRGRHACLCALSPLRDPAALDAGAALDALLAYTSLAPDESPAPDEMRARLATAHELAVRVQALLRPIGDEPETSAATILVVDDEPSLRRALRRQLANAGFAVVEAGSGEEALALFDHVSPDLVVTDVHMSGISGEVLAQRLRTRRAALPILVMSGALTALGPGVATPHTRFLAKPFAREALLAEIGALLGQRSARTSTNS